VLKKYDALVCPVNLLPAPTFDEFQRDWPPPQTATATQTIQFNVTGHPSLSVPIGFTHNNLPIGMQIVTNRHDDATALTIGHSFEKTKTRIRPPVAVSKQYSRVNNKGY